MYIEITGRPLLPMDLMDENKDWQQSNIQYFWSEIAASDHLVQIYDNELAFLNSLEGFTGSGFLAGESVIIIATDNHLKALNSRLLSQGFDISRLIATDQYLPLDADETLDNFMVDGHPDEKRFSKLAQGILSRTRKRGRKVRAFGEMVAILWNQGNREATIELEALWNKFISKEDFCLFCAYPKSALSQTNMNHICSAHTKIISGATGPSTQVFYKNAVEATNVA